MKTKRKTMLQRALDISKHRFDLALLLLRLFSLRFESSLTIGPLTPRTVHSVMHDDEWSLWSGGEYASFHVQLDGCCGSAHASATVLRLKTQVGWDMSITTMQLVGI